MLSAQCSFFTSWDFILLSCDRSVSFCNDLPKALVLTAEVHFRCCDAVFLLPLLCHSINLKLARDLAPLRKFSYRFPPRPEGVFSGFEKKPLYLIATRIVKIKSLHKDFSAKNNIIILLINEILINYKMRGIHFYHVKFFWKLCTKRSFG